MFGISQFSAIINPPQTAILAVGTGRTVLDTSLTKSTMMTVTLSYDRRAIDEDQAADFLAVLRVMLEDPTFLAVGRAQALRHRRE
ncbi:dihydrolipoyllysine-residue acetyltransferase component of pyruvate dehydrogenase complex-like [Belonocnema kinseyi]|uniref:dihydrolipoyllysine-residue acetyltransferase component of pyruvate dehydrogenase complex-like n=1 Tax=Belonocnema kinseyi TaxID=2817044 RepID=UPI00143D4E7D|nr:dihydrolipoyllysine-residue acetyltransferase component of pyruvate dehydrogenase complex-like [Belonocnema kinseyi]